MPDCCLDCPLYNGHGCKATLQMFHPITNIAVRVEGCPLVEVKTPHGRLIDADRLLEHKGYAYDSDGHLMYAVGTGEIMLAPTVIEAEGSEL